MSANVLKFGGGRIKSPSVFCTYAPHPISFRIRAQAHAECRYSHSFQFAEITPLLFNSQAFAISNECADGWRSLPRTPIAAYHAIMSHNREKYSIVCVGMMCMIFGEHKRATLIAHKILVLCSIADCLAHGDKLLSYGMQLTIVNRYQVGSHPSSYRGLRLSGVQGNHPPVVF